MLITNNGSNINEIQQQIYLKIIEFDIIQDKATDRLLESIIL